MKNFEIVSCGAESNHKKSFKFIQSTWPDCWLYTFFKTEFVSATENGFERGAEYSFVLYKPFSKVWHTNTDDSTGGFTNDWMYFRGEFADDLICKLGIPTNVIIQTQMEEYSSEIIRSIRRELAMNAFFKEEKQKALFTLLMVEISRAALENLEEQPRKKLALHHVRDIMLNNFQYRWTINELAELSGYSTSHFANIYRSYFNISPLDELILYRLVQAKYMLESNSLSIKDISQKCGFNSPYYFSRIFKQKNGISPLHYRRKLFQGVL